MDQFDRHRNIENDHFEKADNHEQVAASSSIDGSESPRDCDLGSEPRPEDAHKGAAKLPRAKVQSDSLVAHLASSVYDDEDDEDEDDEDGEPSDGVPSISRKIRRRRRRTRPRSKTIAMKRLTREELRVGALLYPPVDVPRPQTRSECHEQQRPCPWVACKHHLYLDVNPETGSIKLNFPDLEPWELQDTCALDVAERGGITLEEVGEIMNLTRERIRQVEVRGLRKIRACSPSPEELGARTTEDEE
ncbi:MAG TPA: sigma factor-like helix-turn-helix DNA-binding protein [Haliangium sp.]|nr:sigma factor-like helix-turn-helix DNA-binding protein [Haliangium sp.]